MRFILGFLPLAAGLEIVTKNRNHAGSYISTGSHLDNKHSTEVNKTDAKDEAIPERTFHELRQHLKGLLDQGPEGEVKPLPNFAEKQGVAPNGFLSGISLADRMEAIPVDVPEATTPETALTLLASARADAKWNVPSIGSVKPDTAPDEYMLSSNPYGSADFGNIITSLEGMESWDKWINVYAWQDSLDAWRMVWYAVHKIQHVRRCLTATEVCTITEAGTTANAYNILRAIYSDLSIAQEFLSGGEKTINRAFSTWNTIPGVAPGA